MPHIARVLQLRRTIDALEVRIAGLEAALDRLEAGVLLLDAGGAATFANRAVRAIAARGDGLSLDRAGRPVPANADARRRLHEIVDNVTRGGPGGILTIPRPSGARAYAVLIAPSPERAAEYSFDRAESRVIILIHDPDSRPADAADTLHRALGLPPAAARLVAALAGDDDLRSFAGREGISIHTARFHLRTALARTGARTQSELARTALRLLRDFGLGGG